MTSSPGFLFTILAFLLVLGPLIFIHEMGHYLVARWFGVKSDVFSIGFGREVFGWTNKRGTRWKVAWMPLGGYVRFKGDMSAASEPSAEWLALPAEERNQTFQAKPVWQRFLIVLAGPLTNLLFAVIAFMAIFAINGYPTNPAVVGGVQPNSPAARAGLHSGDRVLAVNGGSIDSFMDLETYVALRPGQAMTLSVRRGAQTLQVPLTTQAVNDRDEFGHATRIGRIGIRNHIVYSALPVQELPGTAINMTGSVIRTMVVALGQVISGERSVRELGGPLKMAQVSGEQASLGVLSFFWLMALISINLGFINLLPIPMLDGGHLLFYAIEGVRRRPLKPQAQEWAFRTGLAMLLALMVFITVNDLASFGLFHRLGGLIG